MVRSSHWCRVIGTLVCGVMIGGGFLLGVGEVGMTSALGQVRVRSRAERTRPRIVRRSRLPKKEDLAREVFFDDVYQEALVGSRPATLGKSSHAEVTSNTPEANPDNVAVTTETGSSTGGGTRWSQLISSGSIEDEVKGIQIELEQLITTPAKFSGGGYQDARRLFSELAALFGVIQEYDTTVRWKKSAATARSLFARAAGNAKVSSPQAYNDAKLRKQDLQDLVRSGEMTALPSNEGSMEWGQTIDRSPLMERIDICVEKHLSPATSDVATFQKEKSRLRREAELLRTMAQILIQPGMDDGEADDYVAFCRRLKEGADAYLLSIEQQDLAKARGAGGDIRKACDQCHEQYR